MNWPKPLSSDEIKQIMEYDKQGLTVGEIAEKIGRSRSVVRKKLLPDESFDGDIWEILKRGLK